jgi:hypothetical protein
MKEQQSGFVKQGHYARHLPPPTQQQITGSSARTSTPVPSEAEEAYELEEDESYYHTRLPTSTRRYQVSPAHVYQQGNRRYHVGNVAVPPRTSRHAPYPGERDAYERATPVPPATRYKSRIHPQLYLGVGMLAIVAFFLVLSSAVTWVEQKKDDLVYGRPRTFQIDAVVGHNDSPESPSHFIALNLNRHVEVIEIPGGDSTKERVYPITTLFGDGEDLTPVTLSFRDVTENGKPDMLIHIENQTLVLINDNGTFRPAKPGEVRGLL